MCGQAITQCVNYTRCVPESPQPLMGVLAHTFPRHSSLRSVKEFSGTPTISVAQRRNRTRGESENSKDSEDKKRQHYVVACLWAQQSGTQKPTHVFSKERKLAYDHPQPPSWRTPSGTTQKLRKVDNATKQHAT